LRVLGERVGAGGEGCLLRWLGARIASEVGGQVWLHGRRGPLHRRRLMMRIVQSGRWGYSARGSRVRWANILCLLGGVVVRS